MLSEIWFWLFNVHPGAGSWFLTHPGSRGQKGTGSRIQNTGPRLPAILALRMLSWVSSRVLSHCMSVEKQARSGPEALSVVAMLNNLQRGKIYSPSRIKRLCHEKNTFLKVYNNKLILSVHTLIFFYKFLLLSWWKNQTQSFSLLLLNYLLILKILTVTCFKDLTATISILKCLQEAACDKLSTFSL